MAKKTLPIQINNVTHLINRAYRESRPAQYIRELVKNALEADANHIALGIEWEGAKQGIYRLAVSDNGRGMTRDEIKKYLTSLSEGAKPIGGEHENYGIGARTSLLPWNGAGVIFVSYAKNAKTGEIERSLIHLGHDPLTKAYCAFYIDVEDEEGVTVPDYIIDPDTCGEYKGIDYSKVLPTALGSNFTGTGTAVICLGNTGTEDTIVGPTGKGSNTWMLNELNERFYRLPIGVTLKVEVLYFADKSKWPKERKQHHPTMTGDNGKALRTMEYKRAFGLEHFLKRPGLIEKDNPVVMGEMTLQDGGRLYWFLRHHPIKGSENSIGHGLIGICYQNETYSIKHGSDGTDRYRQFGIIGSEVQKCLSIIIEPPLYQKGQAGIYPDTGRRQVLYKDATGMLLPGIPWRSWAREFVDNMPKEIRARLDVVRQTLIGSGDWNREAFTSYEDRWTGKDSPGAPSPIYVVDPTAPLVKGGPNPHRVHVEFDATTGLHTNNPGGGGTAPHRHPRAAPANPILNVNEPPMWGEFGKGNLEDLAQFDHCMAYLYPDGRVVFNYAFREYQRHLKWTRTYVEHHATAVPEEERDTTAEKLLRNAYHDSLYCKLKHAPAFRKAGWDYDKLLKLCQDPEVLTLMIGGLVDIDEAVQEAVKKLTTTASKTPKKGERSAA